MANQVSFLRATYLGGHEVLGTRSYEGRLVVTPDTAGIAHADNLLKMSAVLSVDVEGAQRSESKTGRVIAFGVLGGLSGANAKNLVNLTFHMRSGQDAYFQIANADAATVRAELAPVLRAAGVPFHEAGSSGTARPAPVGVADELAKLAALRDQGVLTDAEFAAQKAKLLG